MGEDSISIRTTCQSYPFKYSFQLSFDQLNVGIGGIGGTGGIGGIGGIAGIGGIGGIAGIGVTGPPAAPLMNATA